MTTHKAWVSSAIMALVTVILILAYGESPDGMTMKEALEALAGALITGALSWYATWRVPNKSKDDGALIDEPNRLGAPVWSVVAAVGLALLLAGCPATTGTTGLPKDVQVLLTFTKTCNGYDGALNVLGSLRAAGVLDTDDGERVIEIADYATPICSGPPATDRALLDTLERRLNELVLMQLEAGHVN